MLNEPLFPVVTCEFYQQNGRILIVKRANTEIAEQMTYCRPSLEM